MTKSLRTISVAATLALASLGAAVGASAAPNSHSQTNPGATHRHDSTPGPNASAHSKAKAYGKYCQTESKKHVAGEKGTPFSRCVTAMAKLANGQTKSPAKACKTESKKHVAGQKGTPYSKCVSAAAKLKHDQSNDTSTPTGSETTPSS